MSVRKFMHKRDKIVRVSKKAVLVLDEKGKLHYVRTFDDDEVGPYLSTLNMWVMVEVMNALAVRNPEAFMLADEYLRDEFRQKRKVETC